MFTLELEQLEISAAHHLKGTMPTGHKCCNMHGHNWFIDVAIEYHSLHMPEGGVIIDFGKIKAVVMNLDHKNLNDIISVTTAGGISYTLAHQIAHLIKEERGEKFLKQCTVRVRVNESAANTVSYFADFRPIENLLQAFAALVRAMRFTKKGGVA